MQVTEIQWTDTEKTIAKTAFENAHTREIEALVAEVQSLSSAIAQIEDIWNLHDYLSARRHQIDGKYDYRYSVLIFVFAGLLKDGWLHLEELEGLDTEKLKKVAALAKM
jgi:hypothetical protein